MRYGIISDIHANLEALEAVISACRSEGVRMFFCVGDIVGYGANPQECIDRLKEIDAVCIAGNHDWAVLGKVDISDFNAAAREAALWTRDNISEQYHKFLEGLELVYRSEDMMMVHGTLNKPKVFIYMVDMADAMDTFYLMDRKVCFVGHTHVPQIFIKTKESVSYAKRLNTVLEPENKYIVNTGSVGQSRDGNPMAAYCIYDPDLERVEIKRVSYDIETAQRKILEAGLPEILAQRLRIGQ